MVLVDEIRKEGMGRAENGGKERMIGWLLRMEAEGGE
jgi:hypothetical protein